MKKFMIILVLIVLVGASCFVGGVYYGHEVMDSNGTKEVDDDKDTKKTKKEEDKESEKEKEKEEVDNTPKKEIWSNDSYKVELQGDKLLLNDEVLTKNVKKQILVALGSHECEGDSYVVVLKEDGTISTLSIDKLACNDATVFTEDVASIFGEATDIYSKPRLKLVDSEPDYYSVYGVFDGEDIAISSYFKK